MVALHKKWDDLIKPYKLNVKRSADSTYSAKIVIEPLERGYGLTIGNALRRTLLSSIQGAAITALRVSGIAHEFSVIPGVLEDVTTIMMNLKGVAIQKFVDSAKKVMVSVDGPCVFTAGMIPNTNGIEILNPDHYICTVDSGNFNIELEVSSGRGYRLADDIDVESDGFLRMDAFFSPIKSVNYHVENTRVGQNTDYDRLILHIETNGAISPEESVSVAARLLQVQFDQFVKFEETIIEDSVEVKPAEATFNSNLLMKIDELELSVRSMNCLKNDNIVFIGDLVRRSESDMLRTPNFGRKSLNEIKEVLTRLNLNLGMNIPGWPPEGEDSVKEK